MVSDADKAYILVTLRGLAQRGLIPGFSYDARMERVYVGSNRDYTVQEARAFCEGARLVLDGITTSLNEAISAWVADLEGLTTLQGV